MSEMKSEIEPSASLPQGTQQPRQDARDLLARLYREIGISAVSAALNLRDLPEPELQSLRKRDGLAMNGRDDLAA